MSRIIGLFIVLLQAIPVLYAQRQPYSRQFTVEEGLPSNEVYDVTQDENGYLWFCTDHGLVRYDGFNFKVYTIKDGLEDNTVLDFYPSDDGIYFGYYNGGLGLIKDSKIVKLPYSDKIRATDKGKDIVQLIVTQDSLFFLKNQRPTIHSVNKKNGDVRPVKLPRGAVGLVRDKQLIGSKIYPYYSKKARLEDAYLEGDYVQGGYPFKLGLFWNGDLLLSGSVAPYVKKHMQAVIVYKNHRFISEPGQFFVSAEIHGSHCYLATSLGMIVLNSKMEEVNRILPGKFVTNLHVDNEGNTWITTHNDGVYQIPSSRVFPVNLELNPEETLGNLLVAKGRCFAFTESDYRIIDLQTKRIFKRGSNAPALDISVYGDSIFVTESSGHASIFDQNLTGKRKIYDTAYYVPYKGKFYYCPIVAIDSISPLLQVQPVLMRDKLVRIPTTGWFHSNPIKGGFALWNNIIYHHYDVKSGTLSYPLEKQGLEDIRVKRAVSSPREKYVAIGSKSNGLILLYKDRLFQFTQEDGLTAAIINDITFESGSVIWIASSQGLDRVTLDIRSNEIRIKRIDSYSNDNILPFDNVEFCAVAKKRLYFGNAHKLYYIPITELKKCPNRPRVMIDQFIVDDESLDFGSVVELGKGQRNIQIQFQSIQFSDQNKVRYRYKIDPTNTEWIEIDGNSVNFPAQAPGEYFFVVQSSLDGISWSQPKIVRFTIAAYFYEQAWFKVLIALIFLAVVIFIAGWVVKRNKRRAELSNQILASEQKALQAQMNPHFVFNSLNSIQYFISKNEKYEANIYLSEFSQLIRRGFEHSRKGFVPIEKEIELIRSYISLEKMRFKEKFDVVWDLDPEMDGEILIPSMILQPFIENAIWHGLTPLKDRKGRLEINSRQSGDTIVFKISDNGVGIKKEKASKATIKQSRGMEIVKERLELYSRQIDKRMYYVIDSAVGKTVVTVYFPISDEL